MPRTEEANQRIREEQRAKILDAALTVFARQGAEATIAEVAFAANVSYGLVYRYFASKEALLVEAVERVLSDSLRALERALELPSTPGERLRELLTQILYGVREHPEFTLLVQQMLGGEAGRERPGELEQRPGQVQRLSAVQQALRHEAVHDRLRALAREQSRTYRSVLRQLVVEGQVTGEIAPGDPDQLVGAVTACIAGLSQGAVWQAPEQFQKTFPDVEIILRMVVPHEKEKEHARSSLFCL
ncbi:MAG: TetR/AcrR family transcriptional regulator [Chloroflexota bacterium]|nr:TetR/AcrR family transcriptional regulator [Chloroflexota bacterium]